MATERDVTLRLGTKMDAAGDEALRSLGSAAKDAAEQEQRYVQMLASANVRLHERSKLEQQESQWLQQKQRLLNDLATMGASDKAVKAEEQYQQRLRDTVKILEERKRLTKDLQGLGYGKGEEKPGLRGALGEGAKAVGLGSAGSLLSANSPVAFAMALLGAAKTAEHFAPQVSDYGYGPGGQFGFRYGLGGYAKQKAESFLSPIPIIGYAARAANLNDPSFYAEKNAQEAERNIQEVERRAQITTQRDLHRQQQEMQVSALRSQVLFGPNSNDQARAIRRRETAFAEVAMEQTGKKLGGYGAAEERADISRRSELRIQLETQQAEAQRRMAIQGRTIEAAEQIRDEAAQGLANAKSERTKAQTAAGVPGLSDDQRAERQAKVRQAIAVEEQHEQEYLAAQNRLVQERQSQEELLKQTQQQRLQTLQGEHQALTNIIQQERARRQATTEHIGLSNPYQRQAILNVARKIGRGEQLNVREQMFAQQHQDVFGNYLQRLGQQRGAGIMAELLKIPQLGLQAREKAAEQQRVQIANQIQVQIQQDNTALVDQLARKLVPELNKLAQQTAEAAQRALEKAMLEAQAARRAAQQGK